MPTVARISVTPVKALGLVHPARVEVQDIGVPENRLFFLVDQRGELFEATDLGRLMQILPTYEPGEERLSLAFPDGTAVRGDASAAGEAIVVRFSGGREAPAHIVRGPWNGSLSAFAGRPLRLARCVRPGDGNDVHPLTIVSRESVRELAKRGGAKSDLDPARFRMTFEIEGCEPHEEDSWEGGPVDVGNAVVRVLGQVPRCVVTTLNPDTGLKDFDTLKTITTYRPFMRTERRGIPFGVYAEVLRPGIVGIGDAVTPR